jgi:predicted pyridoxine 5'-phosphate oxidase superfamily flavin-nucleotide-binding protein
MSDTICSIAELEAIYGQIVPAAKLKVLDHISEHYGQFIAAAPFVLLAWSKSPGFDAMFASAAAFFCTPKARTSGSGMRSVPMRKSSTLRWVWAPQ